MSRAKNVLSGVSFGILNNILNILLPFISRTIIIRQLGIEYVGLKGIFTSILQVLSLSELGFGVSIGYLLYKPLAEHNTEKVNSILKFYRFIYRIIGFAILAISVLLLPFLDKLITGNIPADINIYILYGIYVLNTVISYFFFAYKRILLSANQRYDVDVSINSIILICQNILQIVLLLTFHNYYVYVIIIPLMTVVNNCIAYRCVNKMYPYYHCIGELDRKDIKEILKNTAGAFFSKVGSTVYLSVDNIVISAFLGITILGIYDNYYYIISSIIAVFAVIHNSIRPVIGNVIAVETKEKAWDYFSRINYVYMLLVIVCSVGVFTLLQDFESLWAGTENLLGTGIVILLTVYLYIGRLGAILTVYQEAAGLFWHGKFIPITSAIVNLVTNIILVRTIGLPGIILSSIISASLITFPGNMYIIFKYLFNEKGYKYQYIKDVLMISFQLIISLFCCTCIAKIIHVTSWITLVFKGGVTIALVCIVLILFNLHNSRVSWIASSVKKRIINKNKAI